MRILFIGDIVGQPGVEFPLVQVGAGSYGTLLLLAEPVQPDPELSPEPLGGQPDRRLGCGDLPETPVGAGASLLELLRDIPQAHPALILVVARVGRLQREEARQ